MQALASTFHPTTGNPVEVEVLSPPSPGGLCKVKHEGKVFARHKDRLVPRNEAAKEMLK
jgi:hypothetical protein